MTRWLILLSTLVIWLATMTAVYRTCRPRALSADAQANRESMQAIFHEHAPLRSDWSIFVNLKETIEPHAKRNPNVRVLFDQDWRTRLARELAEAREKGAGIDEVEVGWMTVIVKRRGETRAERKTHMRFQFPREYSPILAQVVNGEFVMESTEHHNLDQGLEQLDSVFRTGGLGLEVRMRGAREPGGLNISTLFYNADGEIMNRQSTLIPLSDAVAPSLGFSPFEYRPGIQEGDSWQVPMLDTSGRTGAPQMVSTEAKVVGTRRIRLHGKEAHVYEVRAGEGEAASTAYYSIDGIALKTQVRYGDFLSFTMIREEGPPRAEVEIRPAEGFEPMGH